VGIETSIIVPGRLHRWHEPLRACRFSGDKARVAEYESWSYKGFADQVREGFASIVPADRTSRRRGRHREGGRYAFWQTPFRVHIDPTQDGAEVVMQFTIVSVPSSSSDRPQ